MVAYERNGIVVDQCRECRGIFLDRGELERLVYLEGAEAQPAMSAPPPRFDDDRHDRSWRGDAPPQHDQHRGSGHHPKKRKSVWRDILEFD